MWDPFTTAASSHFWNVAKLRAWVGTSRICVKVLLAFSDLSVGPLDFLPLPAMAVLPLSLLLTSHRRFSFLLSPWLGAAEPCGVTGMLPDLGVVLCQFQWLLLFFDGYLLFENTSFYFQFTKFFF